jgi:hypothetical protein
MTPQPLPPEQIKTPRGVGINEGEGGAREDETFWKVETARSRKPRVFRRFVNRGGQLVEVESVVRETR